MKKLFLISAFLISGIISNAQEAAPQKRHASEQKTAQPVTVETKAAKQTNELDRTVTLSPEQKTKVLAINLEKDKLVDTAKTKAGDDKTAFEADRKKINAERRKEIGALLTPEQKELWKKSKKAE